MKKIILYIVLIITITPLMYSCTKNFEDYNKDPYAPLKAPVQVLFDNLILTGAFVHQNNSQHVEQMVGGVFGGYFSMGQTWGGSNFNTYNASDAWNEYPFNEIQVGFYTNYFQIEQDTEQKGHYWAMAKLLRVHAMHRVTDMYGPIPYSKMKRGLTLVPFDSQEEAYNSMFADLDYAIEILSAAVEESSSFKPLAGNDRVYDGDYSSWIRYANSLKLRLAVRISSVSPALAQSMAEEAVAHPGGLITTNSQNASTDVKSEVNPYSITANSWNELRANAAIVNIMTSYKDPRLSAFFTESTLSENESHPYLGLRSGIRSLTFGQSADYSRPLVSAQDRVLFFCAAETAFLRAEGALKGWSMGGTDSKFYEDGVQLSFDQYAAGSSISYLSNSTLKPEVYVASAALSSAGYSPSSTITIAWNESDSDDRKLERIITQKWIANFMVGFEAWADFRRTGYPEIFPAKDNLSNRVVDDARQCRRLRFPLSEYQANEVNTEAAIGLLGGPDNEGTDLWWAKKN